MVSSQVYGCGCGLHGNIPGAVFLSPEGMKALQVRRGDTLHLTLGVHDKAGSSPGMEVIHQPEAPQNAKGDLVIIGRVWSLPLSSCPKSLLTSHSPLGQAPGSAPPPSLLLGTGVIVSLTPFPPLPQLEWPLTVKAITSYTKPVPEAASVVVQAMGKKAMEALGLEGGGAPSVALLQLLRRLLIGAHLAPKGSLSFTLFPGKVVDLVVTRTVPSPPGLGVVAVGKNTKVTITRPTTTQPTPDPLPDSEGNPGVVSKPLDVLLNIIRGLADSCQPRGPQQAPSSGVGWLVPRGVLLSGPPGVGKTYSVRQTAKAIASEVEVMVIAVNGGEVVSAGGYGEVEAELRAVFMRAEEYVMRDGNGNSALACKPRCSLIFLDEMDALCAPSPSSHVVTQLALLLDSFNRTSANLPLPILVVGATNRPDDIDRLLRRPGRFDFEVHVGTPSVEERQRILHYYLAQLKGGSSPDVLEPRHLQSLAESSVGYVPADLQALVREGQLQAAREGRVLKMEDLMKALEVVGASALRGQGIQVPHVDWSEVGGQEEAKLRLRQCVEWPMRYADTLKRLNVPPARGILLYGPPGCSKTTLVRAAVSASRVASFLSLSAGDVYSAYVGDAEATVRRAFALARQAAPCVLFFDEVDAIVGGGREADAKSRVLSTFLNELDGVDVVGSDGVLVVAATNQPHVLDAALLRPGRLSQRIYIPPPTSAERLEILKIQTRRLVWVGGDYEQMPLHEDVDLVSLSGDLTSYWTGADLEALAKEAALSALRQDPDSQQVHHHHFLAAMRTMKPSLSPALLQIYHQVAETWH